MEEPTIKADPAIKNTPIKQRQIIPVIEKTFELDVFDVTIDEYTGKQTYKHVPYEQSVTITATSEADLKSKLSLFQQCGQIAKVKRLISEKNMSDDQIAIPKSVNANDQTLHTTITMPVVSQSSNKVDVKESEYSQTPDVSIFESSKSSEFPQLQRPIKKSTGIRYYKVGDVEIKDDNGTLYQKQWISLTESESANFRVINNKSNAIFNLKDKHIEMKRWVLVDQSAVEDMTILEEN